MTAATLLPCGAVDADIVRQHLRTLMAADIGWRYAADLAGVPRSTVSQLLYRGTRTARSETATRILAVTTDVPARPAAPRSIKPARVEPTGTRRRIQAFHHDGYDTARIGSALNVPAVTVGTWLHNNRGIDANCAQAVADLYRAWAGVPAEDNGASPEAAEAARTLARQRRWATPDAWSSADLDDPCATPERPSRPKIRRAEDVVEDAEWLRATSGDSWRGVADRLGVRKNTLHTYQSRVRKRAAVMAGGAA